jgi:RND family efflux transporter MFP subunit
MEPSASSNDARRTAGDLESARSVPTLAHVRKTLWISFAVAACSSTRAAEPPGGPPPMPVEIAPVKAVPLRDASEYVAVLRALQTVQVQPQASGHVTRIAVTSGDRVQPGAVLMQIDPSQQQASVNSQRAAAEASRATLDYWRKQVARIKHLYEGGAGTRQDLDTALSSLRQAEANAAASEAQTSAGTVQLRYYRVTALVAGAIGDIPVRVGDFVTPQTLLTTLDDNDTLEAYVDVPIERASSVKIGTEVEIIDAAGKVLAPSQVTFISPRADSATQMVLIKSAIDNQSGRLRTEQFVRARVIWSERQGPAVPMLAVQSRAGQSFVWVVAQGPDGRLSAQPRPVKMGPIQDQLYPIVEGLRAGERIVVSGVQKLRPGAPVAPIAATAPGGPSGSPPGQKPGG